MMNMLTKIEPRLPRRMKTPRFFFEHTRTRITYKNRDVYAVLKLSKTGSTTGLGGSYPVTKIHQ